MAASTPGEVRVGPGQQVIDVYVRIDFIHSTVCDIKIQKQKKQTKFPWQKFITHACEQNTVCGGRNSIQIKEVNKKNREKYTFWNVIRSDAAGVFLFRAKWIQKQCLDMISGRMLHRKYYVYKIVELDTLLLYIFIARRK